MFTNKASAQKKISSNISNSNSKSTQLKVLPSIVKPFQIKSSEESLQGKFKAGNNQPAVQLVEDDEPLQGKFESANQPAQLMEEEEPLQGKFDTVQLAKYLNLKNQIVPKDKEKEEEAVQGKFESANQPAQLMEEDEPLQGKFFSGERNSSPNWAFNLNSTNTNSNNSSSNLK